MNLFVLVWLVVSLIPAIAWEFQSASSILRESPLTVLGLVILHLIPALILEGCLYSSLLGYAGRSRTPTQRWVRSSIAIGCVVLWIAYTVGAWGEKIRTNSFPQAYDVNLLEFLADWRTLTLYIAPLDLLLIGTGVVIAATFVLRLIARRKASSCPVSPAFLGLSSSMLLVAIVSSNFLASTETQGATARLLAHHTTPQGTLLGWLLYSSSLQTYTQIPLKLIPVSNSSLPSKAPPFNVLVIAVEALRFDTLAATIDGAPVAPNLRALAASGTSFARAYAQATDTDYSLSTILSGLYPLKFPSRDLGQDLSYPTQTLPELFSSRGYRTSYFSVFDWKTMMRKWHQNSFNLVSDPTIDGGASAFEREQNALRKEKHLPLLSSLQLISLLDDLNFSRFHTWVQQNSTPFFSLVYLYATHYPYANPDDPRESIERRTYYFPESETDAQRQKYLRAVSRADRTIGKYISAVQSLSSSVPTIVVITGDHGEEFYEHGGFLHVGKLHEEVIHVPLVLLNLPPQCAADPRMLVGHVDLAPTFASLLGAPPFPGYHGVSLCDNHDQNRVLFASSQAFAHEDAVLYRDWKCVRPIDDTSSRCFNLALDPKEASPIEHVDAATRSSLTALLAQYRNSLLTYFSMPKKERDQYYPPVPPTSHP